jgi:outer membrane lipoprotein-sorting protein
MIARIRLPWAFALLILPGVLTAQSNDVQPNDRQPNDVQSSDLLNRIWDGVQQAQKKFTSSCGTITETRTSSLMTRPLVLHGKFCAEGTSRFALEYTEPAKMRIRYNDNYLNVTSGDKTEVLDAGSNVRRAQSYFSRENSIGNLKKNFTISVQENSGDYEMKLVPRTDAFRRRLNYLVVKLDKKDFLLRSLEVDGKSGVNSVFVIDVSSLNPKIPPETFEVYKPK